MCFICRKASRSCGWMYICSCFYIGIDFDEFHHPWQAETFGMPQVRCVKLHTLVAILGVGIWCGKSFLTSFIRLGMWMGPQIVFELLKMVQLHKFLKAQSQVPT